MTGCNLSGRSEELQGGETLRFHTVATLILNLRSQSMAPSLDGIWKTNHYCSAGIGELIMSLF